MVGHHPLDHQTPFNIQVATTHYLVCNNVAISLLARIWVHPQINKRIEFFFYKNCLKKKPASIYISQCLQVWLYDWNSMQFNLNMQSKLSLVIGCEKTHTMNWKVEDLNSSEEQRISLACADLLDMDLSVRVMGH